MQSAPTCAGLVRRSRPSVAPGCRRGPVHLAVRPGTGSGAGRLGCRAWHPMTHQPTPGRRNTAARARRAAARYAERLETTAVGRLWSRLLELEFVDRSVALAAKAFVSFLPLLVLVAALSPAGVRENILTIFTTRFGVSGDAFTTVQQAFAAPAQTRTAAGAVGALITLAFAVSFTTSLQRLYLRAWRRPPGGGARNKGRGAAWIGGVLALVMIMALVRAVLAGPTGTVLAWALGLLGSTALWWWTARLMVRGEVRWRALFPTAVVSGVVRGFTRLRQRCGCRSA